MGYFKRLITSWSVSLEAFKMYYVMRASAPSLHRESTDSLIVQRASNIQLCVCVLMVIEVRQPSVCLFEGGLYIHVYMDMKMKLICLYILVYDYVKTTTVLEDWSQHRKKWPHLVVSQSGRYSHCADFLFHSHSMCTIIILH